MEISQETIDKYKTKKVLKILVFILLFVLISLSVFEYIRITPRDVHFTNITSNSITVSWNTKNAVVGTVIVTEKGNSLPILFLPTNKQRNFDSRDIERAEIESIESIEQRVINNEQEGLSYDDFEIDVNVKKVGKYTTHQIKIKNLKPETEYSFLVGDTILFRKVKDISKTSTVKTTTVLENLKTPSPTYGAILDAENKSDLAISELKPVLDGIVYLNLYDKESGKRSNMFSAPLNKEGKWYIDISNAVDSEGNNFIETYSFEGINMYYELELDAGKLGKWKTMDFASSLSPSVPFIINSPDTVQDIDIPGSVVKLSDNMLDSLVSNTFATDGDCTFSKYCEYVKEEKGRYISVDSFSECNNGNEIETKLDARKCNGGSYDNEQENAELTCSGKSIGDTGYNNGKCYICQKQSQNGYYVARWVITDNYTVNKNYGCDKISTPEPDPEPVQSISEPTPEPQPQEDNVEDIQCTSTNKDYDSCRIEDSIVLGSWVKTLCTCVKPGQIEGSKCFESDALSSKNLTYWENDKKLACVGGTMKEVETSNLSTPCIQGEFCEYMGIRERCLAEDQTTLLYCHFTSLTWEIEKDDKSKWFEISAHEIVETPRGEKCDAVSCICKTGTDHKLNLGEWCIDTPNCIGAQGLVCNKEGNTCKYLDSGSSQCSGPIKSSSIPSFKLLSNNLVPKVFAQENETQEYIIDSASGLISDIESGIYTFEVGNTTYIFFIDEQSLKSNDGKILLFIDTNNNEIFDEGTDTKVSDLSSKIVISTIQKEYRYQLVQGFNFVSFPFLSVTESARTASGMLEMLNYLTDGSVYSIAKYDSNWEIVGKNGEGYYSNDFQLIPGQGYVIKVIKDVEVSLPGYPIKFESESDSVALSLFPGWNLVGLYGSKLKGYSAKSLLQDINAYDKVDFTADIVNGWDQDVQGYEGFVLENETGIELGYGLDFPINTLRSYFIRVQDGTGNWQPKLAE